MSRWTRASVLLALAALLGACEPAPRCTPQSCGGCCTEADECVSGTEREACGVEGAACVACPAAYACAQNTCTERGIAAPPLAWTWVDFPDSRCASGAPTGVGINPTTESTDVLIFLQGGGACWDFITCVVFPTASTFTYGAAQFAADSALASFGRGPGDPFRELSWVYVPYCTADVHAGDAQRAHDPTQPSRITYHRGRRNLELYLERLADTFPRAKRVFVAGSSAGGYGAQLNYPRFSAAFPAAEVHLLADSAQMVNPTAGRLAQWTAAWDVEAPASCSDCATDFTAYPGWLASTYPQRRFGLLAFEQDNVLSVFFYTALGPAMQGPTRALLDRWYQGGNARAFVLPDQSHVMLNRLQLATPDGGTVGAWVRAWVDGDAGWSTVRP